MSARFWLGCLITLFLLLAGNINAWAGITDDNYDGNIFVLYAGNGSLVPPKVSLQQSLELGKPAVVVFYVDDSRDCKKFAINLNRWQAKYTPRLSIIPINVDSLTANSKEMHLFKGLVPQTVVIDQGGQVHLDLVGSSLAEKVDEAIDRIFFAKLLPSQEK